MTRNMRHQWGLLHSSPLLAPDRPGPQDGEVRPDKEQEEKVSGFNEEVAHLERVQEGADSDRPGL